MSALGLKEEVGLLQWLGGFTILFGIAICNFRFKRAKVSSNLKIY